MKKTILIVLACLAPGFATVLGDLAASMQPRTWRPISTDLNYDMYNGGPVMDIIWAYGSECCWDSKSRQLLFLGSPHGAESKFIIYDEAANHWRQETTCREPQTSSSRFGHAYDMRTVDTDRGVYWIHTYNGPRYLFRYDPSANRWDSIVPSGTWDNTNMNSIAYFPDKKCIIAYSGTDGSVRRLDVDTYAWSLVGNTGTAMGYETVIQYNARYHCMVMGGSDGGIAPLYGLDTNFAVSRLTTPAFRIGCSSAELVCDPGTGDLLVFDGTRIRAFSMENKAWEDIAMNPAAIANFGITGPTCIFGTVPEYNCHILLNASSYNMLVYKHSAGGVDVAEAASPGPADRKGLITIFPNPGRAPDIRINHEEAGGVLRIMDVRGRIVSRDGLRSGIYVVQILSGNRIAAEKRMVIVR